MFGVLKSSDFLAFFVSCSPVVQGSYQMERQLRSAHLLPCTQGWVIEAFFFVPESPWGLVAWKWYNLGICSLVWWSRQHNAWHSKWLVSFCMCGSNTTALYSEMEWTSDMQSSGQKHRFVWMKPSLEFAFLHICQWCVSVWSISSPLEIWMLR